MLSKSEEEDFELSIYEAWNWLKVHVLLIPAEGSNGTSGFLRLGKRAKKLLIETEFIQYTHSVNFNKNLLHPSIRNAVWLDLISGRYDSAVLTAFKRLDVIVKERSNLTEKYGTDLMRTAFNPNNGKLVDENLQMAEKESMMAIMAGSIGLFKNPQSHRFVDISDPIKAFQLVIIASHLIGLID